MNTLIRILGTILILLAFICALLCFIYVIQVELYEIFEVDVLFKFKRKLEVLCYGEKRQTKALGKLFQRGTSRSRRNRKTLSTIKSRLREKQYQSVSVSHNQTKATKKA